MASLRWNWTQITEPENLEEFGVGGLLVFAGEALLDAGYTDVSVTDDARGWREGWTIAVTYLPADAGKFWEVVALSGLDDDGAGYEIERVHKAIRSRMV